MERLARGFSIIGFFTMLTGIANFIYGATQAISGDPLSPSNSIFTAFAFGLFGGAP